MPGEALGDGIISYGLESVSPDNNSFNHQITSDCQIRFQYVTDKGQESGLITK